MTDLRSLIADTLAAHRDEIRRDGDHVIFGCTCGHVDGRVSKPVPPQLVQDMFAAYYGHRADALLSALNGQLIPEGSHVETIRSVQGEDSEGPWITYVHEVDWPLQQDGQRFVAEQITTPWRPVESVAAG